MSRKCGSCTACCKVMGVTELNKPAWKWCEYAVEGGCSVYENRPNSCREFKCHWLNNNRFLSKKDRPDRLS